MISIEHIKVVEKEKITIETPFYYKYDLMLDECDSIIYGKITDDCVISVQKTDRYYDHEITFEFEVDEHPYFQRYSDYMTEKQHLSSKEEYETAIAEMKKFIEDRA